MALKSTADLKISEKLVDQVIGQDEAVNVIKKAAHQRRHVVLIGEPGTGKSMIAQALAELLPKSKLRDIVCYPNAADENTPLIKTLPAGEGKKEVQKAMLQSSQIFKNQNIILFFLAVVAMVAPWWIRKKYQSDVMFAAFFLGGMIFLAVFVMMLNFGQRMAMNKVGLPKVIVDNSENGKAPFYDATGAHAGALLGDCLHDPFQCFFNEQKVQIKTSRGIKTIKINEEIDAYMDRNKNKVLIKEEKNYEALFISKNELFVLGETFGSVSPVEVLSCNRQEYEGEMIKLTTFENKELVVTPGHKIAVWRNGKVDYIEAQHVVEGDEVAAKSEDIIIDAEDIITTYDAPQQEQSRLYYQYIETKAAHPDWGYKRIAKSLGLEYHKTRWWHAKKHIPVPVHTVNWLKEQGLLPLKIDNPTLPLIAKVLGATFGDGGIFENLNGIFLSSSEKEAVEEFGRDIEQIFSLSKDENSRIIEGGVKGHSWCYQHTNRNVIRFFKALGAPIGNKTGLELHVPGWIGISCIFEEEFFGSLLGGELGSPKVHKQKNRLNTLDLAITGKPLFEKNRIEFLRDLKKYLEKKDVLCTSILKGKTPTEGNYKYRLMISIKFDNVVRFIANVKINYCRYKKEKLINSMDEFRKLKGEKYHQLIKRGYGAESAMKLLQLTPTSLYTVLNEEKITS